MRQFRFLRRVLGPVGGAAGLGAVASTPAAAPHPGPQIHPGSREALQAFLASEGKSVLSFVGYSDAGYEDPSAMLAMADHVLSAHDPAHTLVNIGATASGIGAVYGLARRRGFTTMGVVSSRARDEAVPWSPDVQHVFVVPDRHWGGRLPDGRGLTPTSECLVGCSTWMVGLGGGDAARDELLAARACGVDVRFVPADQHHATAQARARGRGEAEPEDFRGSAHRAMMPPP
jgi:hypothetical protein